MDNEENLISLCPHCGKPLKARVITLRAMSKKTNELMAWATKLKLEKFFFAVCLFSILLYQKIIMFGNMVPPP